MQYLAALKLSISTLIPCPFRRIHCSKLLATRSVDHCRNKLVNRIVLIAIWVLQWRAIVLELHGFHNHAITLWNHHQIALIKRFPWLCLLRRFLTKLQFCYHWRHEAELEHLYICMTFTWNKSTKATSCRVYWTSSRSAYDIEYRIGARQIAAGPTWKILNVITLANM